MSAERLITVLDFDKGEVRKTTAEQAREETAELCRKSGHYFATRWPDRPRPDSRCMCGDIAFSEWPS